MNYTFNSWKGFKATVAATVTGETLMTVEQERSLEGWDRERVEGPDLAQRFVVERAFDYRGDVTVVHRDGVRSSAISSIATSTPASHSRSCSHATELPLPPSVRRHRVDPLHGSGYRRGQFLRRLAAQPGSGEGDQARFEGVTRVLVLTAVDVEARGLAGHLGLERVRQSAWPHFGAGALEIACVGLRASQLPARAPELGPFDVVIPAGVRGGLRPRPGGR